MSFSLSFDMRLLPATLHDTIKAWRSANKSWYSLELEQLYQLATAQDWALLASLFTQMKWDYNLIDAHVKWVRARKLQWFWSEGDREASRLRERFRIQLIWAFEGHFGEFPSLLELCVIMVKLGSR